ncbi:MAG: helix-turn-helix transcriptional regulator [Clostridiaceae bacterium]|nr:helix-turn-helix transcriptional regulator [Clostridiaceae bacterium]
MKKRIKDILLLRTMFSKLLISFLLIILTVSSFYFYAYKTYLKIIETEITVNMDERFNMVVEKSEQIFESIKNSLVQLYSEEEMYPFVNGRSTSMYDKRALYMKFKERMYEKNYSRINDYIRVIYVMPEQPDSIIVESLGTHNIDVFYNKFFYNDQYTKEFWIDEMDRGFNFKIYPAGIFHNNSRLNPTQSVLAPFVFKKINDSNCMLISLVRINDIIKSIDSSFLNHYYIYNSDGELIYPEQSKLDILDSATILKYGTHDKFVKIDEGYLFTREPKVNGLKYYRLVPDAQLKQQLAKVNMVFRILLALALLFSTLMSLFIVIKFNNPVKQIAELITQSINPGLKQIKQSGHSLSHYNSNIFDLNYIRDNIKLLIKQNVDYARDVNIRNSDIETFLYQARMKDIYIQASEIDKIKDKLSINRKYLLVYFKIHFRKSFLNIIPKEREISKITFLFKELIQLYIKEHFRSSITFQNGDKDIVSIINIEKNQYDMSALIDEVINQLEHDREYVYFTIAVGDIYENVSYLKEAYNNVFEITKHRLLLEETQILTTESVKKNSSNFYFPIEQMEELSGLIRKANKEESLKMVSDILNYNLKKNVNSFYIKLLCMEIVNLSIKLLIGIYNNTPEEIDTAGVYYQLENCNSIEDYEFVCSKFIEDILSYISENKKEDDYIIDFITKYVEEHYTEDIYLDLFSEKLNLSTAYISSYFKTKTGINLTDYINNYRIKKSIELIENSQLKVKDIALRVGFSNSNTFIRLFKKFSGFTPQEYRRSKTGDNSVS